MRPSTVRQSVAPIRQGHLPPQTVNPAATAKLLEKKKEFELVQALEKASANFLNRMEGLSDDFDTMADAGAVCGQVLEQWPQMFRILGLVLSSREQSADTNENVDPTTPGERLVRVPIDALQLDKR